MDCPTIEPDTRRINYNKLVHTLTNRASNFQSGAFPDNFNFQPSGGLKEDWEKIQKYLMLDISRTDYYLIFALGILEAHPDIKELIGSRRETHEFFNLPKLKSEIQGADFIMNGIYYSKFLPYKYKFPIPEIYTLKYNSDSLIQIVSPHRSYLKKCNIVKNYGENNDPLPQSYLTFDWSDELPLKGNLEFTGHWNEGASITINFVPHSINIKAWIEAIEKNNDVISFLQKVTLYESYLLARSDQEKLALLYAALCLQHDTWKDFEDE